MLIRLISHHVKNPMHIDKLIRIEGLPDAFLYDVRGGRKFIKEPWKIDPPENLPARIRESFDTTEIWLRTAPYQKGAEVLEDKMDVYALQLDYQNGQGEAMWQKIERMIELSTPRSEAIPVPVKVAESRIEPFMIDASDIPFVDVGEHEKVIVKPAPGNGAEKVVPAVSLPCPVCGKVFTKESAIRMHKARTGHREKPAVAAA